MNRKESEQLLDDVLGDAAPADFRAALLDVTLGRVRRRNRFRRVRRGAALFTVLLGVITVALWKGFPPGSQPFQFRNPDLVVIHSRPLDPSLIVRTRPGTVAVVNSSLSGLAVVETGKSRSVFQEIDDEGLLALLHGRPVALVRRGPHQAELIFLNPEDQKGFPLE
jgi:hypothetical protein